MSHVKSSSHIYLVLLITIGRTVNDSKFSIFYVQTKHDRTSSVKFYVQRKSLLNWRRESGHTHPVQTVPIVRFGDLTYAL